MTWPAVIFWLYFLGAALSRGPALLYAFSVAGAFQTLQMLPGEALGGANLLPQSICAVFLIGKFLMRPGNLVAGVAVALDIRRLALLFAFLAYAVGTAFVLPWLFQDRATVITVVAPITGLSLLRPSSQNITQSGYMTISIMTCMVFAVLGRREDFRRHYLISLLIGGVTLIATGLVDLVTYRLGISAILDPFRNASFTLFLDSEALGLKRVVGLMPEASAYGGACVASGSALAFLRPLFPSRWLRHAIVPMVTTGLLLMGVVSTSSGALIGLGVFGAAYGANLVFRFNSPAAPDRQSLEWEVIAAILVTFALLCVIVLSPSVLTPLTDLVDRLLFQKSGTSSYVERNLWTSVAMDAFEGTGGWGVGLGGARTSNWFASIVASTGFVGALFMFGFMLVQFTYVSTARSRTREWRRGARLSLIPPLVISWFSGTIPDIGLGPGSLYGVIASTTGDGDDERLGASG